MDLINDKHTKFVNGGSFINKDMEEEMIGITIKNKKHRLVIMTRSKEDKWEIIKPTKNPRRPYTTDLYPHGLLENQNDRHEIRFDEKSNLVIDQTGNFGLKKVYANDPNDIPLDEEIFNKAYEFYLDDKLIAIKNYNADLGYFLKNTDSYTLKDVYNFFSNDLEAFNKSIYELMELFHVENYFNKWNVRISAYDDFNFELGEYLTDRIVYKHPCYLSAAYFKTICIPKLQALIQPKLDALAKDGFIKHTLVTEQDKWYVARINQDIPFRSFRYGLLPNQVATTWPLRRSFYYEDLNFQLYGLSNNDDFKKIKKQLDDWVIEVANKMNNDLSLNAIMGYDNIIGYLDKNMNIKDDSRGITIENSPITHIAESATSYSGKFVYTHRIYDLTFNNGAVCLLRYKDNVLNFESFKLSKLNDILEQYKSIDNIPLKNTITNPQDLNKWEYSIEPDSVTIYFNIKKDLTEFDKTFAVWKNPPEMQRKIAHLIRPSDYTKYEQYIILCEYSYFRSSLIFQFKIPLDQNLNIDEIIHNIYNEFKDKLIQDSYREEKKPEKNIKLVKLF